MSSSITSKVTGAATKAVAVCQQALAVAAIKGPANAIARRHFSVARKEGASWPRAVPQMNDDAKEPAQNDIVIDKSHFEPLGSWSHDQLQNSRSHNPFMLTWAPGSVRDSIPMITHGDGIYLYDYNGKEYIDWTSQAVCSNLGHSLPEAIVTSSAKQMATVPYLYGGIGLQEIRVRMNQLMNEILPGDLTAALFPSSGAEANEAGMMLARRYTGRQKVLTFYRSYHGATASALAATGDFRRWYGKEQNSGFIKAFNPFPLFWKYSGDTEAERTETALAMLEEMILNENPNDIASICMESIVGAGGCLVYPEGYMQGVRAICDRYGILLHIDEVMVGFGRTGKLFGFQHYDGVQPDIVTAAKGISGAAVPLSMMACRRDLMEPFEKVPLGYGSTYQAHGVALAGAYETVKHLVKEDIIGQVQRLAPVFEEEMARLTSVHDSIKQYRCIGLFGCMDVHDPHTGENPKLQHEKAHDAFMQYKQAYAENGLMGLHRYPHIHVAPPLIITEDHLREGFARHDRAICVLDDALGCNLDPVHLEEA
jgi:taurine--2-oxoglutarate transaminase